MDTSWKPAVEEFHSLRNEFTSFLSFNKLNTVAHPFSEIFTYAGPTTPQAISTQDDILAPTNETEDTPLNPIKGTPSPDGTKSAAPTPPGMQKSSFVPWNTRMETVEEQFFPLANKSLNVAPGIIEDTSMQMQQKEKKKGSKEDDTPKDVPQDAVERARARLEDLEAEQQEGSTITITSAEYRKHLSSMTEELKVAWNGGERVRALKLVIQAAKSLSDTGPGMFYPVHFSKVAELLDTFGQLLYTRLLEISAQLGEPLGPQFSAKQVHAEAKETCRNWFYKIASIRELIPRLYAELAILRCYAFLSEREFTPTLNRLSSMIRGVGDPLVASYLRMYLGRVGRTVPVGSLDYQLSNYSDQLFTFCQLSSQSHGARLDKLGLTADEYASLLEPSLSWVAACLLNQRDEATHEAALAKYSELSSSALALTCLVREINPEVLARHATTVLELCKASSAIGMSKANLYVALGTAFAQSPPPQEMRRQVLNEAWKVIGKLNDHSLYLSACAAWLPFASKACGQKEVNILLGDLVRRISVDREAWRAHVKILEEVVLSMLKSASNLADLFATPKFLSLFDMFEGVAKVQIAKSCLKLFGSSDSHISDTVVIHAIMDIARAAHDSLTALATDEDRIEISNLVVSFLKKVTISDRDASLSFLVEVRKSFSNLEVVLEHAIYEVLSLCLAAYKAANGKIGKRVHGFTRACIANAFVSIPALDSVASRLSLYSLASQVACTIGALPQCESLLRASITQLTEMEPTLTADGQVRSSQAYLLGYLPELMATLSFVPGHPDKGGLGTIKGLSAALKTIDWNVLNCSALPAHAWMFVLVASMLSSVPPVQVKNVPPNHEIFLGNESYTLAVTQLLKEVQENMFTAFSNMKESSEEIRIAADLAVQILAATSALPDTWPHVENAALNITAMVKRGGIPPPSWAKLEGDIAACGEGLPAKILKKI